VALSGRYAPDLGDRGFSTIKTIGFESNSHHEFNYLERNNCGTHLTSSHTYIYKLWILEDILLLREEIQQLKGCQHPEIHDAHLTKSPILLDNIPVSFHIYNGMALAAMAPRTRFPDCSTE
jgi:hypothetical protein